MQWALLIWKTPCNKTSPLVWNCGLSMIGQPAVLQKCPHSLSMKEIQAERTKICRLFGHQICPIGEIKTMLKSMEHFEWLNWLDPLDLRKMHSLGRYYNASSTFWYSAVADSGCYFFSWFRTWSPTPQKVNILHFFSWIFMRAFFPIGLRGEVEWCFYRPESLNSKVRHFHGILGYFDRRRLYLIHVDRCKSQWPCWFGRVCERLHAVSWKKENSSKSG